MCGKNYRSDFHYNVPPLHCLTLGLPHLKKDGGPDSRSSTSKRKPFLYRSGFLHGGIVIQTQASTHCCGCTICFVLFFFFGPLFSFFIPDVIFSVRKSTKKLKKKSSVVGGKKRQMTFMSATIAVTRMMHICRSSFRRSPFQFLPAFLNKNPPSAAER